MQNLIAVFCLALGVSGMAHAVDYQQLGDSVGTGKAVAALMK